MCDAIKQFITHYSILTSLIIIEFLGFASLKSQVIFKEKLPNNVIEKRSKKDIAAWIRSCCITCCSIPSQAQIKQNSYCQQHH